MRWRAAIVLLFLAAGTLVGGAARAGDQKRAEALFKEGLDEMMAGKLDSGCPKIEEAYRQTQGIGALFTLAECYAQWGKPAGALQHYRAYLTAYARLAPDVRRRQEERAKLATTQVAALSALVPTLQIVLAGDDRAGATVTVDGHNVAVDALDGPLKLEVGVHSVVVTAADGRTVEQSFHLAEGAERRWQVKLPSPVAPKIQQPAEDEGTPVTTAGFVMGSLGLAAMAVGAVTGGLAVGKRGTADEHCADLVCDQEGLDAIDSGKILGDTSTATLAIGGAAFLVGVILLAVGDEGDTTEALSVTPHGLRWRF